MSWSVWWYVFLPNLLQIVRCNLFGACHELSGLRLHDAVARLRYIPLPTMRNHEECGWIVHNPSIGVSMP